MSRRVRAHTHHPNHKPRARPEGGCGTRPPWGRVGRVRNARISHHVATDAQHPQPAKGGLKTHPTPDLPVTPKACQSIGDAPPVRRGGRTTCPLGAVAPLRAQKVHRTFCKTPSGPKSGAALPFRPVSRSQKPLYKTAKHPPQPCTKRSIRGASPRQPHQVVVPPHL